MAVLLSSVVAFGVDIHFAFCDLDVCRSIATDIVSKVCRLSRSAKDSFIGNHAREIDDFTARQNRKCDLFSFGVNEITIRCHASPLFFVFDGGNRNGWRPVVPVNGFNNAQNPYSMRWSQTKIFCSQGNFTRAAGNLVISIFNVHIGSQLPLLRISHLANGKGTDNDEPDRYDHQKTVESSNIGVGDLYVAYISMRPILFLSLRCGCTIFGYLIAGSRYEQFQRNKCRRFIADGFGLLLARLATP
jgi:hypothetical protein